MDERPLLIAIALCAAMAVLGAIPAGECLPSMAFRTAETAAVGAASRICCGWGCGSSRTKNNEPCQRCQPMPSQMFTALHQRFYALNVVVIVLLLPKPRSGLVDSGDLRAFAAHWRHQSGAGISRAPSHRRGDISGNAKAKKACIWTATRSGDRQKKPRGTQLDFGKGDLGRGNTR